MSKAPNKPHLSKNVSPAPKIHHVRCLGPSRTEHWFYSSDAAKCRICPRCERAQKAMHLSARQIAALSAACDLPQG